MAVHAIVPLHATQTAEREIWTEVLEGTFDELMVEAAKYKVGTPLDVSSEDFDGGEIWSEYQGNCINCALSLSRKEGLLGELTHSFMYVLKREMWTLDMAEITKDIRTWLALKMGTVEAAPELAKIALWQATKDNGDYTTWANFKYYDGSGAVQSLAGDTKKLAEKMIKGVDSYTIYAPVLTRSTTWATMPDSVGTVGVIETPAVREGWEIVGGNITEWVGLANAWLKTASRSNPNSDGTYNLIEQWTGADKIDGDLYPTATTPPPEENIATGDGE